MEIPKELARARAMKRTVAVMRARVEEAGIQASRKANMQQTCRGDGGDKKRKKLIRSVIWPGTQTSPGGAACRTSMFQKKMQRSNPPTAGRSAAMRSWRRRRVPTARKCLR